MKPRPRSHYVNNCGFRPANDGVGIGQTTVPGLECGVCGDALALQTPRPHEFGGEFGKLGPKAIFRGSEVIESKAEVMNPHGGFLQWRLCDNVLTENQDCFNAHQLEVVSAYAHNMSHIRLEKGTQVNVNIAARPNGASLYVTVKLRLPSGVHCSNCVIQFNYRAGRSWHDYKPEELPQETFRSCSDIEIIPEAAPRELLQNIETGKCLGQESIVGSNLKLHDCDHEAAESILVVGGWENAAIRNVSITIESTGKCVDVKAGSMSPGGKVLQYDCQMADNQLWFTKYETENSDSLEVISKKSGLCLSTKESRIIQNICKTSNTQWRILRRN